MERGNTMHNFSYYAPTQVVFGRGAEAQVGALVKAQNCKKVLIHYGGCWTVSAPRWRRRAWPSQSWGAWPPTPG